MSDILGVVQLFFSLVIGMYFFGRLRAESADDKSMNDNCRADAERLNAMRKIHLTEPITETTRPCCESEIIGQADGVKALKSALCGKNPQHVLIYGPPGVGKTAAARLALDIAKKSEGTPFKKDAAFIEADATTMQYDERAIADPLIGSVHDPIYQGAGAYGNAGVPHPKLGAVSKAHGGVLFLDEIGELPSIQINRLLKVLEDRCVHFESSYYSASNKKIPVYIHEVFKKGVPADFRLIGATTRLPKDIPEAIRSRCVEIYFDALKKSDIEEIIRNAAMKTNINISEEIISYIADYAQSGRDAVKILQSVSSCVSMEGRSEVTMEDAKWVIKAGRYTKNNDDVSKNDGKIIDISLIKPKN